MPAHAAPLLSSPSLLTASPLNLPLLNSIHTNISAFIPRFAAGTPTSADYANVASQLSLLQNELTTKNANTAFISMAKEMAPNPGGFDPVAFADMAAAAIHP